MLHEVGEDVNNVSQNINLRPETRANILDRQTNITTLSTLCFIFN